METVAVCPLVTFVVVPVIVKPASAVAALTVFPPATGDRAIVGDDDVTVISVPPVTVSEESWNVAPAKLCAGSSSSASVEPFSIT